MIFYLIKNLKFKIKNSQKGVSLIITLFIMIIILAVVLSISTLLYSEIKVLRNVGNSVIAFYAADSGVEKVLYYDRQAIPGGAARGICDVCNVCLKDTTRKICSSCTATNTSTTPTNGCITCTNCKVVFKTNMETPQKEYEEVVNISTADVPGSCPLSTVYIESYGSYLNAKRAINLYATGEVKTGFGPKIDGSGTVFTIKPNGTEQIDIDAITPSGLLEVTAYIYKNGVFLEEEKLTGGGQTGQWHAVWNGGPGDYYVTIGAIDAKGYCASICAGVNCS